MNWHKNGLVYAPSGLHGWDKSYAHLPTAHLTGGETLRVYFAALDEERYGRIGFIDVSADQPGLIKAISTTPALDLGEQGTFDDSGVNPSCLVERNGTQYLYYIGWQRCQRVPYMLFAGVAVSENGTTFRRLSRAPILDRTTDEPFLRSATSIICDQDVMRCWYVSARGWTTVQGALYPEYVVRYAESGDGLQWRAYKHICIELRDDEFGIGRPWVVRDGSLYRMWYSIRSRTAPYRIGYAESADGIEWERKDEECTIPRSEAGWDSEMICYPCVTDVGARRYLFYNGNQHGATGFGYATLTDADNPC